MPIKLTSTLEGDLLVEILKIKPGLHISRKDRKHMVAPTCFKLSSVHISQEIFANDILTALKPSFRT